MKAKIWKWTRWTGALLLCLVLVSAGQVPQQASAQMSMPGPRIGMVCTTGASPNPTFTLTAKDGYIVLPDANVVYMWGYSEGDNAFQHPGPVLCVNEGDTVTIVLKNTLSEDVSIVFPGQENVLADGAPVQPVFDGGGTLTSLAPVAAANGGSITYSFVASHPGTFLYESGTNPAIQVQMGLFGALIVRPAMGPNFVYNRADSEFDPNEEFLMLLSEIDPLMHQAVERGEPFNMDDYLPRYWMMNGRGFPDTVADNFASWLPSQPYGALARIYPNSATHTVPSVTRYLSVGTEPYPIHPHGGNARFIGCDGRPLEGPAGEDLSYEKFTINVGPGQTYEGLFYWWDVEGWDPVTNPIPVPVPQDQNLVLGMFYSGSPYLGLSQAPPPNVMTVNLCGEYYHISHNHALHKVTSWGGIVMTGQVTYARIDPPLPNYCPY